MTRITFDGFHMEAQGHAGYARVGEDIVCAGMSMLFAAAAEMIMHMETMHMMDKAPKIKLCPGDVLIEADPLPEAVERTRVIFEYLMTGCMILADSYPENVCIYSAER